MATIIRRWRKAAAVCLAMGALVLPACSSGGSSSSSSSPTSTTAKAGATTPKRLGADPGATSAGDPSQAAYTPTGTLIADDGFRPEANGFKFENYGALPDGGTNMTPAEVRKIFGDGVCADAKAGKCDLIPEAQAWMEQTNTAMGGGHCYGFAVASQLLWQGSTAKPSAFGADTTPALTLPGNLELQKQIAYNWAFQTLDSVNSARVTGTPNDIIAKLKDVLHPNPTEIYTLAFFKRDGNGGHAVTPFAIEDHGGGIDNILVYDNNWPGVTRAVTVDTNANTWQYVAALNPKEPSEVYDGDAATKSLMLYPTNPALAPQTCPFCGKVPGATGGASFRSNGTANGELATVHADTPNPDTMDEIYLDGSDANHGHLLITDESGHQLGFVNGKLINSLPGAKIVQPMSDQSWLASEEPEYYVPDGPKYTITLDGSGLTDSDQEMVGVIGPSFELSASEINLAPGEKDTIVIGKDGSQFSYTPGRTETPKLELAVSDESADYTFDVSGEATQAGSTITLGIPEEGTSLQIAAASSSSLDLSMTREDESGPVSFKHSGIALTTGDSAEVQFGNFKAASDGIPLVVTHNGSKQTQTLTNEP